jgi:hypothetical protein
LPNVINSNLKRAAKFGEKEKEKFFSKGENEV